MISWKKACFWVDRQAGLLQTIRSIVYPRKVVVLLHEGVFLYEKTCFYVDRQAGAGFPSV